MRVRLISWESCNKCKFIHPHLQKRCEKNGHEFIDKDINEATQEEIWDAMSLPIIWFDDEQLDYDNVLAKII